MNCHPITADKSSRHFKASSKWSKTGLITLGFLAILSACGQRSDLVLPADEEANSDELSSADSSSVESNAARLVN